MTDKEKTPWYHDWKKLYGAVFLLSLIFLLIGFSIERYKPLTQVLIYFHREWGPAEFVQSLVIYFVIEIGIALLVACVLGITIERLSQKEIISLTNTMVMTIKEEGRKLAAEERAQIKDDVFRAVFGSSIPETITKEIISQVLKAVFVRENLKMKYTLKPKVSELTKVKYILLELEMTYDIRNLTTDDHRFSLNNFLVDSPFAELANEVKFLSVQIENSKRTVEWIGEKIPIGKRNPHIYLDLQDVITIAGEQTATVTVRAQSVKHYEGGSEYFSFGLHTCDLELTAQVLDAPLKIYCGAFSNRELMPTKTDAPDRGYYNRTSGLPVLAFQGVYIIWVPTEQVENEAISQAGS
ncbi:MAG TPA: hypothetical protein VK619_19985, partial [Pyrinomonadaceae bacterium]|nr:hypothetical protein [Pyrinomonadaceae bacterium]